ncbi:MAG: Cna B-type domain-containing protein [Actinomycetaceae bacterium]|nr:Cna B-type domain-containing protein [Actinomycetaceae bacterium]
MKKELKHKRKRWGRLSAVLAAFTVLLGLVVPSLAPALTAEAAIDLTKGNVIVEKEFVGISQNEIPTNFQITLKSTDGKHTYSTNDANVADPLKPDIKPNSVVQRWRINGAPIGDYTISESGEDVPGYEVAATTVTVDGNTVELSDGVSVNIPQPSFTVKNEGVITSNSYNVFPVKLDDVKNTFFAASSTDGVILIVTQNVVPQEQKEHIETGVRKLGANFANKRIEYVDIATKGTDFKAFGVHITYSQAAGEITIERTKQWNKVATLFYDVREATPTARVTNTYKEEPVTIPVEKKWAGDSGKDADRPDYVKVNLYAGIDQDPTDSLKLTAPDWAGEFTGLARFDDKGDPINYKVEEVPVPGYTPSTPVKNDDGSFTITNTLKPMTISGEKTWDDNNDQDGKRPEQITINVLADGKKVASEVVKADADGKWAWSFTDLPKYKDGQEIKYTITEDAVDYYTPEYDGYNVTNTHTPETMTISGEKTWDDNNDQDGKRPEQITINVLADGKKVASEVVKADADGKWAWSFTDLPKYKDGQEIKYTITEDAVDYYTPEYDGYNFTNTHTPGKTSVQVIKAWDDANNQDGVRPGSVEITLVADGEVTDKTLTLNEKNNWTSTFTELDEYKAGKKIVYTVKELKLDNGYKSEITGDATKGFVVKNSRTPETTAVEGVKTWEDKDNKSGKRPESITINLLANGKEIQEVKVTAKDDWKWTFTDLPKFENGKEITYTITEDKVKGYTTKVDGYNVTNTIIPEKPALPKTGASTGLFTGLAAALLGVGGLLVALRRKHG